MALQFSNAFVPFGTGLAQDLDERIVPAGGDNVRLLEARNLQIDKWGRVSKRQGYTAMTRLDSDGGTITVARGLFSTGIELCMIGATRLYSYEDTHGRWYDRGQLGPCEAAPRELYHGQLNYACPDMALANDYVLYVAWTEHESESALPTAATTTYSIMQSVRTADGHSVIPPTEYYRAQGDNALAPHAPRACSVASKLFALWLTNDASPCKIYRSDYNTATPTTPPTSPASGSPMFSDVYYAGSTYYDGLNTRTYDAVNMGDAGWVLAYIRNTDQALMLYRYNSSHVLQSSGSIAGPWYAVAAAVDSGDDNVYLLLVSDGVEVADQVKLYKVNTSFAVQWGPTTLQTLTIGETVHNLGCCESGSYVASTWDGELPNSVEAATYHRDAVASSGALNKTLGTIHNATVRSRPWLVGGRTYAWLDTSIAGLDEDEETVQFFECSFMVDLNVNDDNPFGRVPTQHILSGLHSIGIVPPYGGGAGFVNRGMVRWNGSANNVVNFSPSVYRYMAPRLGRSIQDADPRLSADEVFLDFTKHPLSAQVNRGGAIVGGSFYAWFAGTVTEELGFACPPIVEHRDDGAGQIFPNDSALTGGTLPHGTYSWQAIFESNDERGNLHRSLPSNIVLHEKDSGDAVILSLKTQPATLRYKVGQTGKYAAMVVYRGAADGVFKQMTRPNRLIPNIDSDYTQELYDFGALFDTGTGNGTGTPIYTTGGAEIPNVAPNGGLIVAKIGQRVWVARKDEIQYSKTIAPRTGAEDVRAPEFYELLGFLTPSGRDVTGLGDLDGKAFISTSEEIYIVAGRGPDDAGNGNDFSELSPVADDGGCIEPRSVVSCPYGVLYQAKNGTIYMLDRSLQVTFVGHPVEDTLAEYPIITSAVTVAHKNEVRFTCNKARIGETTGVIVVWNYEKTQWTVWDVTTSIPNQPFVGACVHDRGTPAAPDPTYHVVTPTGYVYYEDDSTWYDAGSNWVTAAGRTAHLQRAQQSGWQRVRSATLLAERKDPHNLTVEIYSDFEATASQSYTFTDAAIATFPGLPREQLRAGIKRQKSQAIQYRWYDSEAAASVTGQGAIYAGLTLEIGVKRGTVKVSKQQRS
jgi:hypothetical protein